MKSTAKSRVLSALQEAGSLGQTTAALCQPGCGGVRFSARILELRQEGHVIHERRLRSGSWLYVYISGPSRPQRDRPPTETGTLRGDDPAGVHSVEVLPLSGAIVYETDSQTVIDFTRGEAA